jgi:Transposase DDE domain
MLVELFCTIDDFLKSQELPLVKRIVAKNATRNRAGSLSTSELMTIFIWFHCSGYKNFKQYYIEYVCRHLRKEFPGLISYSRFIQLMPRLVMPIATFLKACFGKCSGISIIDSTPINVCHNRRITRNKVFSDLAERGKTTMGWFFGFKLHLITNDKGELLSVTLTKGNVDDRQPVPKMVKNIFGHLFGDKGYLSGTLSEKLRSNGVRLITTIRKNMTNKLMPLFDKIMLRKRFIIETINDKLKNECQIEHTRHRSPTNFLINLLAGLICYQMSPKKPALKIPNNFNQTIIA